MKKTSLLIIVLLSSLAANGISHNSFRHFLSTDGLPINTVTCSVTDHLGYLWFGTRDGICRFDGSEFRVLEFQDSGHSASGLIFAVSEDKDGRIWFCSVNGTGYYDIYTGKRFDVPELSGRKFTDITADGEGNVWFSSEESIMMRNSTTGEYKEFNDGYSAGAIHSVCDGNGTIWFTACSGGLFCWDAELGRFSNLIIPAPMDGGERLECVSPLDDSHLVLSTDRCRILLFDIRTRKAITMSKTENTVNCLLARNSVEIWIGTSEGTLIYDRLKDELHQAYETSSNEMKKNITCILKDYEGNIWTGSFYGGLNIWNNPEHSVARFFDTGKPGSFTGHLTHAFACDGTDHLLIGTEDGCLNRMNLSDLSFSVIPVNGKKSTDMNIHGLLMEGKKMWIATFNKGLYRMDTATGVCSKHPESPSDTCVCIKKLKDGTLLIGTLNGLFRYDGAADSFRQVNGLSGRFIHSICQDSQGRIWIGTYGDGLFRSDDLSMTFSSISPECDDCLQTFARYTTDVFEDSDGNIWVATDGAGLHRISPDGTILTHLTRNSGLPSNIAAAITQDSRGKLWVSTTKGIAVIDIPSSSVEKTFLDYSETTGDQYINGSVLSLDDGRIFFGTTNGFISVNPSTVIDPLSKAPLYFTSVSTQWKQQKRFHSEEGKSVLFTNKFEFRESEASYLSISFSCPYYSDLFTPQYETALYRGKRKLAGSITSENTVSLTRLPPGKYSFRVHLLGSDNDESYKSLDIRIKPPFYHSTAAIIFVILLIIGIVLYIQKSMFAKRISDEENKMKLMESRKQQEISESKLDFMTEITHQIRTPLSLIKMPIEKIIHENDYTETSREDIFTIKTNTDRLLELTDKFIEARTNNEKPVMSVKEEGQELKSDSEDAEFEEEQPNHEASAKPTVLVVEDEGDMRLYLEKELSSTYNIRSAANGQEAVEIISENKVDLVVSDIMMPVMDGCQLCNFIKTNEEYSHIPVILLTAVVGVETRIETLESGADGYIEKPFKMELLKANIQNLFRNKEIFYKQFANSPLSHFKSTTSNKVENAFMEKLHAAVMKHLADQELGIDMLTDILGTSKTTLYRKIKSNTGLNTNEYIRLCRLKKAADMLSSQEYRINEVAYLTGFSSPSYFATSFQKQFNISPSAFVKNLK